MDLLWLDDLDLFGGETSTDLEELEQDTLHVLAQDRGSNLDDPERGVGCANILSSGLAPSLARLAESEIQKDDRVNAATATLTQQADGSFSLDVTITTNDDVLDVSVPVGAGDGSSNP